MAHFLGVLAVPSAWRGLPAMLRLRGVATAPSRPLRLILGRPDAQLYPATPQPVGRQKTAPHDAAGGIAALRRTALLEQTLERRSTGDGTRTPSSARSRDPAISVADSGKATFSLLDGLSHSCLQLRHVVEWSFAETLCRLIRASAHAEEFMESSIAGV